MLRYMSNCRIRESVFLRSSCLIAFGQIQFNGRSDSIEFFCRLHWLSKIWYHKRENVKITDCPFKSVCHSGRWNSPFFVIQKEHMQNVYTQQLQFYFYWNNYLKLLYPLAEAYFQIFSRLWDFVCELWIFYCIVLLLRPICW